VEDSSDKTLTHQSQDQTRGLAVGRPVNKRLSWQKLRSLPWQPFAIGGLAFYLVTGGAILRPGNLGWLMTWDRATYLLGWMFFRNTPLLQQPLGANWPYGMDVSSSIVYPDGVPLLALLLKPFSGVLPVHFQYFGIWILICYLLQAFFAWKILGLVTNRPLHRSVSVLFFVLAPVFAGRQVFHFAVGSHWLLLACLYLYLLNRFRWGHWALLLVLASLINPYLFVMSLLFFGATLLKRFASGELSGFAVLKGGASVGLLLIFVMWEAGYFTTLTVGSSGFGFYRTNILGFLNPDFGGGSWSHIFRDQPTGKGDYEGFCFLGTGIILLSLFAAVEVLRQRIGWKRWRADWPLILLVGFTLLIALSNNVAIGQKVIFHYDIPKVFERPADSLRASGRFIWPAYYVTIVCVLAVALKGFSARASLGLISFCAMLQVADSWNTLGLIRSSYVVKFDKAGNHPAILKSEFWRRVSEKYDGIACVLPLDQPEPHDEPENYFPVCYFSALHHMSINQAYLARIDQRKLDASRASLIHSIQDGHLNSRMLYVFQSPALWATAILKASPSDWIGVVDGFKIIAPGWGNENDGAPSTVRDLFMRHHLLAYHLGSRVEFAQGTSGLQFLGYGWSVPESWGLWSDGGVASIALLLNQEPAADCVLQLEGDGFVRPNHPQQIIEVFVNGAAAGQFVYSLQGDVGVRTIRIPRELLSCNQGLVQITLRFPNNVSPAAIGLNSDVRNLAFALKALTLSAAEQSQYQSPGERSGNVN
jgi:hypothetical protein